jgi:mortality factor 4-like protein 1
VYVPHTDRYYEAKILKGEFRFASSCSCRKGCLRPHPHLCPRGEGQGGWYYFLHYNGWNKKYDEWVEEGGLVKAEEAEALGAAVSVFRQGSR